jgi:outer membrane murein-binding lipoprotein Lpp
MTDAKSFTEQVEELKAQIRQLPEDHDAETIERTAARLEGLNYAPSVITPNAAFLRLDKQGMLDEIGRIVEMPEEEACALAPGDDKKCEDLRLQFMKVILFYYQKLLRLREGDAEEWDEIDELYVHD